MYIKQVAKQAIVYDFDYVITYFKKEPLSFSKGCFDLPTRLGLGIDFDEGALLKRPPKLYRGVAVLYDANAEPGSGSGY
jgi:hypothetical protein